MIKQQHFILCLYPVQISSNMKIPTKHKTYSDCQSRWKSCFGISNCHISIFAPSFGIERFLSNFKIVRSLGMVWKGKQTNFHAKEPFQKKPNKLQYIRECWSIIHSFSLFRWNQLPCLFSCLLRVLDIIGGTLLGISSTTQFYSQKNQKKKKKKQE